MNSSYQPGTLAPLVPKPAKSGKSRKGLWIGLVVGLVVLCCAATVAAGVIERNRIASLFQQLGSKSPVSLGTHSLQAENDIWLVKVLSVETSADSLYDSQGSYITPKSGFNFLVVKTLVVNKTTDSQTFTMGMGGGGATLKGADGTTYSLSAVNRGGSITINAPNTLNMLYIYPNSPDGESIDFYFAVPTGARPASFTFLDMSPISPLPTP
ncbi:MAG TPA: hypothetical protein VMC09_09330 [Anaerolineales bacterium]|nr:hypothetical protein [Anaerolineales bacterium]